MFEMLQRMWSYHRSGNEHDAAPVVQRKHVPPVAAEGLERRRRFAVGNVDFAIAGAATDQQAGLVGGVLEEAQIADRSVVHRQFDFLALELLLVLVEAHQLDRFVVGTGRDQVTHRRPRHAVDRAFVVFRPLEQNGGLVRGVVFPGRVGNNWSRLMW